MPIYVVIYSGIHTHTDAYISILHYHCRLVQLENIKKKSERLSKLNVLYCTSLDEFLDQRKKGILLECTEI